MIHKPFWLALALAISVMAGNTQAQSPDSVLDEILLPNRAPAAPSPHPARPVLLPTNQLQCDIPESLRQRNWTSRGSGSCVIASTVQVFRAMGLHEFAEMFRKNYGGGQTSQSIISKLEKSGLPYDYTNDGDITFLERATRQGIPCGIFYKPAHAITCVHVDSERVGLIDNNRPDKIEWVNRSTFESNWKRRYGGFGWTVSLPPPPRMIRVVSIPRQVPDN